MERQIDLRSFLNALSKAGLLVDVTCEVDWSWEIGAVSRKLLDKGGPAVCFNNIKDYNDGREIAGRLVTGLLADPRRLRLAFNAAPGLSNKELIAHVKDRLEQSVEPKEVNCGSVHTHCLLGDEVDLRRLPVPKWFHLDGGRYINTFATCVTRDPDTGVMNCGVYRGMLLDARKIGVLLIGSSGWGQHFHKYKARGQKMPVACVYGWHPVLEMMAGSPIRHGLCEYDVAGAFLEQPIELVKCRTNDLLVPADAEMVVEGVIDPSEDSYELEGPYGEFTGHMSGVASRKPVITVTALTHRDDPIFRGTLEGSLPGSASENSYLSSVMRAAIAWKIMENAGVPGVTEVYVHPVTNGTNIVIQIDKQSEGHAKWVAAALWSSAAAQYRYKNVVVVDTDIDPADYAALDWALAYRVSAGTDDVVVYKGSFGSPIDPSTPEEWRDMDRLRTGLWNRVLIDATRTWRGSSKPEWEGASFPPTLRTLVDDEKKVIARWAEYGLPG